MNEQQVVYVYELADQHIPIVGSKHSHESVHCVGGEMVTDSHTYFQCEHVGDTPIPCPVCCPGYVYERNLSILRFRKRGKGHLAVLCGACLGVAIQYATLVPDHTTMGLAESPEEATTLAEAGPEQKFSVTILWGDEHDSLLPGEDEEELGSEPEYFTAEAIEDDAETYTFDTQAELDAFMQGCHACNGWLSFYVKNDFIGQESEDQAEWIFFS